MFSNAHKTHRLLIACLSMIALLAVPVIASPAGRIVIEGSATGSHLRLSTDGSNILVDGAMAETPPRGCVFTHNHDAAACQIG